MRPRPSLRSALGLAIVCALASSALARLDDTFALVYKPVKGKQLRAKYVAELEVSVGKVKVMGDVSNTVEEVKADGTYVSASRQQNIKVYLGDKLVQSKDDQPGGKTTYAPDGQTLVFDESALEGEPVSNAIVFSRATEFVSPPKPVKLNEEWTIEFKADKEKDVLAGTAKFKVTGTEAVQGINCALVEMNFKQKGDDDLPVSSSNKLWIDLASGETLKSVVNAKNFPFAGGMTIKVGTITTEIVK